ncbi:hypothetical protein O181_023210 [Austropuccinia psidii MF-1]|uniref:Uncharacterized protein n=1 Tax=Austropuccinia psidii MF-1 TaxID=1389203 RepID=A0A9Q3CIR1_9BASI|nr:hypothetical protein [Austropuccinia psidii MF-1]
MIISTRTLSKAYINPESSDDQHNPPPQASVQALSCQSYYNNNDQPSPPPPKFVIPQPSLRNLMKSPTPKLILTSFQEGFSYKNHISSLHQPDYLQKKSLAAF